MPGYRKYVTRKRIITAFIAHDGKGKEMKTELPGTVTALRCMKRARDIFETDKAFATDIETVEYIYYLPTKAFFDYAGRVTADKADTLK